MFADLLPYFKRDKVDMSQYYKNDLDAWSWKDKLYGFPFQIEGETVFYNKTLLTAQGVPFPKADWSTDDLVQPRSAPPTRPRTSLGCWWRTPLSSTPLGRSSGSSAARSSTKRATRRSTATTSSRSRAASYLTEFTTKYAVTPTADATKALPQGTRAMEGRLVAMAIGDVSRHQDIRNALGAENVDFAPTPKGPGGPLARVYSNNWSILSLSKARDTAWEVLKWTHSKEGLSGAQLRAIGSQPVKWASQAPVWMDQFKGTHIADVQKLWETDGHDQAELPEGSQALTIANEPLPARCGASLRSATR